MVRRSWVYCTCRSKRSQHAMEPNIGSESRFLPTPPVFDAPVRGSRRPNIAVTLVDGPQNGNGQVGRLCLYVNKIWCGFVHALLRYRSKTTEMEKFPIDSYNNENFIPPFIRPGDRWPPKGEKTHSEPEYARMQNLAWIGPRVVEKSLTKKRTKNKQKTKKKHTVKQIPRPSL